MSSFPDRFLHYAYVTIEEKEKPVTFVCLEVNTVQIMLIVFSCNRQNQGFEVLKLHVMDLYLKESKQTGVSGDAPPTPSPGSW